MDDQNLPPAEPPTIPVSQASRPVPLDGDHQALTSEDRTRRIGASLLWGQTGRVLEISLGLLFSVLVVRVLGPADYAAYAVIWSVVNVAAMLASLGYAEALTRYLPALNLDNPRAAGTLVRQFLWERILASLIIGLGVWAGAAALAEWTHTPRLQQWIGMAVVLIVAQGLWELFVAYYTATLRMREHTAVRIVSQVSNLALALLLFARFGIEIWVPLVAQLASFLVSIVLYAYGARHTSGLPGQPISLGAARRFGAYVWLTNLATFGLASQVDVLLIAVLIRDNTQISFYNVAMLILAKLYMLLTGWTAVLIPTAAEARARDGVGGMARSLDLFLKINFAILLPALIFVFAWADSMVVLLFGDSFAPAGFLLRVFAAFSIASCLVGGGVCHPLLYVADRQRTLLGLRIMAGALNILLDILLIPPMGAAGAVVGTGISNLITHLIEFGLSQRFVGGGYPTELALKFMGASVLAGSPALLFSGMGWISFVGGSLLFGVIFVGAVRLLRPVSSADYAGLHIAVPRLSPVLRWIVAE